MNGLKLSEFLNLPGVLFDVRSPAEYVQGRIPGAINLPLFTDDERTAVGTLYKRSGKSAAVELGLGFAGPKLKDFARTAKEYASAGSAKVYCWRGGLRSASMAWLLNVSGLEAVTLSGGYKVFRRESLETFSRPFHFCVVGGFTGSGKTAILQELKKLKEQVLDLEQIAQHRGSVYGMIGMPVQNSTEQFENEIAAQLAAFDPSTPIWIEDESRMIGRCKIPDPLYHQMNRSPLILIESPLNKRVERLKQDYGDSNPLQLIEATKRIAKRLGGTRTQEIVRLIQAGDLAQAIQISLQYYDSTYNYGLSRRSSPVHRVSSEGLTIEECAKKIKNIL
jgi:tRNA 2-selenouridine synthase